jgi:deoxyadenosine/deoxycytidine kinase
VENFQNNSYIDLLGPSGVGKTTLYEALIRSRNSELNICSLNEALIDDYLMDTRFSFVKKVLLRYLKISYKPKLAEMYLDIWISNNEGFIQQIFYNLSMKETILCRDKDKITLLNWFLGLAQVSIFCKQGSFRKNLLLNEGILHNLNVVFGDNWKEININLLRKFLINQFLPSKCIVLSLQKEEVLARIGQRKASTVFTKDVDLKDLLYITELYENRLKILLPILEELGVEVFIIDANQSVDSITKEVINFLIQK